MGTEEGRRGGARAGGGEGEGRVGSESEDGAGMEATVTVCHNQSGLEAEPQLLDSFIWCRAPKLLT